MANVQQLQVVFSLGLAQSGNGPPPFNDTNLTYFVTFNNRVVYAATARVSATGKGSVERPFRHPTRSSWMNLWDPHFADNYVDVVRM